MSSGYDLLCEHRTRTIKQMEQQQQQQYGGKWNSGGGQGQAQAQEHFQQSQSQAPHASLASHFHLLPLVEKLANGIEAGSRDQHFDTLLEELTNQFTRCQQLLNSISGTISSKSMTVEGQKRLLEETMQQLNQRRDLMNKYRLGVEEVTKSSNI